MRIVSHISAEDIARNRASERIRSALVEFAANVLRVTRGAGKPQELPTQASRFAKEVLAYENVAYAAPHPSLFSTALAIGADVPSGVAGEEAKEHRAEQLMLRGALQITASRLLGQVLVEGSGQRELEEGVRRLEMLRDERRSRQ